jgi:hypothetical protein
MPDDAATLLAAIPDSPAGRQLGWYLGVLVSQGESATAADHERYAPQLAKRMARAATDEQARRNFRGWAERVGEILQVTIRSASEFQLEASISGAKDRKWRLKMVVEPAPPHRIVRQQFDRELDADVEVRQAVESDAAALAEIERRCPIVMSGKSMYFDRGADYFASKRLMEEATVGIALVDGRPAAASCGALHQIRVGGVVRSLVTVTHLRVLPEHQRKGLWGAVNRSFDHYFDDVDGSRAYISVENAGMQHGFTNTPNKWSKPIYRMQLATAKLAGPPAGRDATAAEAGAIVEIMNRCHEREEQYLPYTETSLVARVTRSQRDYSWSRLRMTDRAVIGVWPAGESLKVVRESGGTRTESRPAIVVDYGFSGGGEDEFEALLRGWCAWANERELDTLSIFSSDASPGHALLRSLASAVEPFFVWTPGIEEPAGSAAEHGIYVDPIYF